MNEIQVLLNQIITNDFSKAEKTLDELLKVRSYEEVQSIKPTIAENYLWGRKGRKI